MGHWANWNTHVKVKLFKDFDFFGMEYIGKLILIAIEKIMIQKQYILIGDIFKP